MTSLQLHDAGGGRGPVRPEERALAPDLARGMMLLFIAVANAANVAFAGPPVAPDPHGVDRFLNTVMALFVDARAYPVFAIMFGYGVVALARRQQDAGGNARRVLLRRNAWLVVFGVVHAALLYYGDFLGAYGLVGIAVTLLLLPRSDRFHRLALWVWALQLVDAVVIGFLAVSGLRPGSQHGVTSTPIASLTTADYGRSVIERLAEWPAHTASVLGFIVIVWLGVWAGRHRLLEHPAAQRRLFRSTLVVAGAVMVVGGLPYALVAGGWIDVAPESVPMLEMLHGLSGEFGGPAYLALVGLIAAQVSRSGPVVRAVAALGQRSLSGYLVQSVAWLALLTPIGAGLAGHDGATMSITIVTAVVVWGVSVAAAGRLGDRGRPGPAETLLRRLSYPR